jgi:hypothetical protein
MTKAELPYDFCTFVAAQRGVTHVEAFSPIRAWVENIRTTILQQGARGMLRRDVHAARDDDTAECR